VNSAHNIQDWHSAGLVGYHGHRYTSAYHRGDPALPKRTCVDMPEEEHAQMLAALRRARYGSLLARHSLLWGAAGRHPTDIAAVLCCARSRV
jgi:hypothetical protein